MDGLVTLADLPELAGSDPKPRVTIPIGRLDDNLRDPRYGKFAITQQQVDGWKRNLAGVMGGQVSIDFDHSSDRGNGTRAAAWIKSIDQQGKLITADVEFSKRGARAVRNGDYKYTSPTFVENYTDEHGVKHGPALIGAALTNRPVLRKGMPTLSLSRDEFDDVAIPSQARRERKRARKMLSARDSRAQMDRDELIKALGLDADADLASITSAVVTLAASPPSPSHTPGAIANANGTKGGLTAGNPPKGSKKASKKAKKLRKQTLASDDGTMTLSAEQLAQLLLDANAGATAAVTLAQERFDTAWRKALDEGRAAPSQEETLKTLHSENPDLAIKTLDSFVKIVPTRPAGSGDGGAAGGAAPEGMDPDRFQLHTEAKALAAKKLSDNPKLDEADAYILAVNEIDERQFQLANPGI